jgi:hypothetical protein
MATIKNQVNIKKSYLVLTLRLSVLYGPLPCTNFTDRFCITEVESVYCTVRTETLYRVITSLCAPDNYGIKTSKNILNSFNHLP